MSESRNGAALVVDVGTAWTKAALFDIVEGVHRFVAGGAATTTLHGSHDDVSVGIRYAVARVEEISGRTLQDAGGPIVVPQQSDGNGVDVFASTSSLGDQLRLLLLADGSDSSFADTVKDAARAFGAHLEALPKEDSDSSRRSNPHESLLAAVERLNPHAVVIASGEKGGSSAWVSEVVESVSKQVRRTEDTTPAVLFVGGTADSATVTGALSDRYVLRTVSCPGSPAGPEIAQCLGEELTRLWQTRIVERIPGYALVTSWQNQPVLPTSLGLGGALSFISNFHERPVVGVDVGVSTVSLYRIQDGKREVLAARNFGAGGQSISDLRPIVRSWLPVEYGKEGLTTAIWNKWARPWSIPSTATEGYLETACAVAALKLARSGFPGGFQFPAGRNRGLLVACGGAFASPNRRAEELIALLDGVEPLGVFDIAVDRLGILPQLGALAALDPQAAADVVLNDGLTFLASCIACGGVAKSGSSAIRLDLRTREHPKARLDVQFGTVKLVSAGSLPQAETPVRVASGLNVGWGRGKGGKLSFQPGRGGLVIDARGRPVQLPREDGPALKKRKEWLGAFGVVEEQIK